MKALDVIRRSGRNLGSAKVRTLLTALALAVGGFTLTLTLAAANGARAYTQKAVEANFDPDSLIVAKDASLFEAQTGGSEPREYTPDTGQAFGITLKLLDDKDIEKMEKTEDVEAVIRQYNMAADYITRAGGKRMTGALNVYNAGQKPQLVAGQIGDELADGMVLLPDVYVAPLGFTSPSSAVGQDVMVQVSQPSGKTRQYTFKVMGVTTKSDLAISFDAPGLYLSEADAGRVNAYVNDGLPSGGRLPTAIVRGDGSVAPDELKRRLEAGGYVARTSKDLQSFLNQIIQVLQVIILVFGFITLVASFFGVVNTQYISVLERTREIGLMKALGMRRGTVSWLFIIEAAWIGFIGALLGSLAAIAVGTALNPFISKQVNFGDESLLIFDPLQVGALVGFLMLVTAIAGLLPARKAARLDPIEALRTE
jgi:putative ABC transport system permease protein